MLRPTSRRPADAFSGDRRKVCSTFNCYCYVRGRDAGWSARYG
ncbi:hypothetical protein L842_1069 [Mycobacterium intracellulare MIN_052511_1280]|nr:hypothetical protein L842_1069 [Mycobacterium intracellulare MIN_052511_1280]